MRVNNDRPIRIWALLGVHAGDNNQVLALAEGLGLPFETKRLEYHEDLKQGFWAVRKRWLLRALPPSLVGLTSASRASLAGEPPDLVIAIGSRSAPIVRALRRRSRGRMRAVQLGNPRVSPSHFDLVLTTPQYPVPDAANVVRLPISLGRSLVHPPPSEGTKTFFERMPAPRRLLLLGGPTRFWQLDLADVTEAIAGLIRDARAKGGSLIVLASPRTPEDIIAAATAALVDAPVPATVAPYHGPPSYSELLVAADTIFVTSDSVAMISEALRTGTAIGLVPVRLKDRAKKRFARHDLQHPGQPMHPRDLRYFWAALKERGLVGTTAAPARGEILDVNGTAVALVRRLLEPQGQLATDIRDSVPSARVSQVEHSQA